MYKETLYIEDFARELHGKTSGNIKTFCPFCHSNRHNKRDKSFSINCATMAYNCHYCGESGYLKSRVDESRKQFEKENRQMAKTYKKPSVKPNIQPTLDASMVEYFKGRGISEKTLLAAKVTKETAWFPQDNGKRGCIAFNYYVDGEHVNTKYRTRDKHFTFIAGAKTVPYNIDSIAESAYGEDEKKYCIITEGEADTLTYIECGYKHVISMPNGANANLEWMDDFVESHFDKLEVVYISTDSDQKGVAARNEFVRRFGADIVKVVYYPNDCKDINEVLVKHGRDEVKRCFEEAVDIKPDGIIEVGDVWESLDDLFFHGLQRGMTVGVPSLDNILSFKTGMLTVVTGIPSHGKTFALNYMLARLNILHDWKIGFFSPEFYPVREHIAQVIETLGGARFSSQNYTQQTYELLKDYTSRNFFWVDPDDTDINSILERAKFLIRKKGIRAVVIDPFNSVTDKERKAQKQDEYISDFLQKTRWFARKYDVAMFLVMHPTKQVKQENGLYLKCDLYNCKGASEIYDKADIGITVWRNELQEYAEIIVTKMKFRHLGDKGTATFKFNKYNGRYSEVMSAEEAKLANLQMIDVPVEWDNTNWVVEKMKASQIQQDFNFEENKETNNTDGMPFGTQTSDCPF